LNPRLHFLGEVTHLKADHVPDSVSKFFQDFPVNDQK
jgi:hypothetical protein